MARENDSSVRIGSITIFALVVVLCVAVMGMLSVSTGRAALAASEKQALYSSEIYQNEKEAWEFVSSVDAALQELKESWWWSKDEGLAAASEVAAQASDATVEGDVITATFTSANNKTLTVKMTVTDDLTLNINEWKVSMAREMDTGDVLWNGN